MKEEIAFLINKLEQLSKLNDYILTWGSPVPSFGSLSTSRLATIGINPSNREFVDQDGSELVGANRRFHTLRSLGLNDWSEIEEEHLVLIWSLCDEYFSRNPYDGWFKKLDNIISGTSMSYYF